MADLAVVHRKAQLAIRAQAMSDMARLWPAMDWRALDQSFPAWFQSMAALIAGHRILSSSAAARYLRSARFAAGIPGDAPVVLAAAVPEEKLRVALATTAVWGAKAASVQGVSANQAMANAFVRSSGAATRLILEGGRQTITETAKADGRAVGMRRVTSANPCDFCAQLATNPELQFDFQAHDHCGCSAAVTYA